MMYQFCSVVTICTIQYIPFSSVHLIRCVWVYISGSQSLVVISILFAKDTPQIHTAARCAQKKIVTAAKKDRELTQWTSLNDGLSPPS